jgi:hypothetical protein
MRKAKAKVKARIVIPSAYRNTPNAIQKNENY